MKRNPSLWARVAAIPPRRLLIFLAWWKVGMCYRFSPLWENPYMSNPYENRLDQRKSGESTGANSLRSPLFPSIESRRENNF